MKDTLYYQFILFFRQKKHQCINNLSLLYKNAHTIENKTASLNIGPSREFSANSASNTTFRNHLPSS